MLSSGRAEVQRAGDVSELARPRWFDDLVGERLEHARAVAGCTSGAYRIAGRSVRIRVATRDVLVPLAYAFEHLRAGGIGEPALTIEIWDSASTGLEPPRPLEGPRASDAAGAFYYHDEPGFRIAYQPEPGALSALDSRSGTAWYWVRDFDELPYWDCATPIRHILHWWLTEQGCLQVHAGAVGTPERGGVLLVGKGGSGKSTSTLACLGSGLKFAGDDYVAVTASSPPRVHSLYNSAKLEPAHVDRFAHLRPSLANGERLATEKAVLHLDGRFPDATIDGFTLKAILLPRVTNASAPRIAPASRAEALSALAPSTIFQLHPPGPDALATMVRLVAAVPAFVLQLGADIPAIPHEIDRLLDDLADGGGAT